MLAQLPSLQIFLRAASGMVQTSAAIGAAFLEAFGDKSSVHGTRCTCTQKNVNQIYIYIRLLTTS